MQNNIGICNANKTPVGNGLRHGKPFGSPRFLQKHGFTLSAAVPLSHKTCFRVLFYNVRIFFGTTYVLFRKAYQRN